MGFRPTREEVYAFLQDTDRKRATGALGYLNQAGGPSVARVAFSVTPALGVIFGTSDTTRKFRLLHTDRRVSFEVTDDELRRTVQIEGRVDELSKHALARYEDRHYAKLGEASRRFKDLPDQHFFIITPTWLRFSDCLEEPWTTTILIGN